MIYITNSQSALILNRRPFPRAIPDQEMSVEQADCLEDLKVKPVSSFCYIIWSKPVSLISEWLNIFNKLSDKGSNNLNKFYYLLPTPVLVYVLVRRSSIHPTFQSHWGYLKRCIIDCDVKFYVSSSVLPTHHQPISQCNINILDTTYRMHLCGLLSLLTILAMQGIEGTDLVEKISPTQTGAKNVDKNVMKTDVISSHMQHVTSRKNGIRFNSARINSEERGHRRKGQVLEITKSQYWPEQTNGHLLKYITLNKIGRPKRQASVAKDIISYNDSSNINNPSNNISSLSKEKSETMARKRGNLDNAQQGSTFDNVQERTNQDEATWEGKPEMSTGLQKPIQSYSKIRNSVSPNYKKPQLSDLYRRRRVKKLWQSQKAMADTLFKNKQDFLSPYLLYTTTVLPQPNNGYTNRIFPYSNYYRGSDGNGDNTEPRDNVDDPNVVPQTIEGQNYKEIQSQVDRFRKQLPQLDQQPPAWFRSEEGIMRLHNNEDVEKTNLLPEKNPYDPELMNNLHENNQLSSFPELNFKPPNFPENFKMPTFPEIFKMPTFPENYNFKMPTIPEIKPVNVFKPARFVPRFSFRG
ncbi:hypothetical protein Btru_049249 [Bulinus truncatus]|nr:hypothetical protein Btru_049249 [Bulinus truncatus]